MGPIIMKQHDKSVCVIVLNYNTYEKSVACIESVIMQSYSNFDILLVDNNSTDNSFDELHNLFGDSIKYLHNDENYGYAKGNNIAVKKCKNDNYDYCLILNSDVTLVGRDCIDSLLCAFDSLSDVAVVAPLVFNVTSKGLELNVNTSNYLKALSLFGIIPATYKINDCLETINEAHGSALMVDVEKFISVGGFPEHYFMYGEESTLAKKLLWNGNAILWNKDNENYVLHHHDKSSSVDKWRLYLMARNRALEFFENYHTISYWWILIYVAFLFKTFINENRKVYFKGVIDAFILQRNKNYYEACFDQGKQAINYNWS